MEHTKKEKLLFGFIIVIIFIVNVYFAVLFIKSSCVFTSSNTINKEDHISLVNWIGARDITTGVLIFTLLKTIGILK